MPVPPRRHRDARLRHARRGRRQPRPPCSGRAHQQGLIETAGVGLRRADRRRDGDPATVIRHARRGAAAGDIEDAGTGAELTGGDGVKGKVTDLSLIYTTLWVNKNQTILVPNNLFFQRIIKRHAGTVTVGLDYQLRQDQPMPASQD